MANWTLGRMQVQSREECANLSAGVDKSDARSSNLLSSLLLCVWIIRCSMFLERYVKWLLLQGWWVSHDDVDSIVWFPYSLFELTTAKHTLKIHNEFKVPDLVVAHTKCKQEILNVFVTQFYIWPVANWVNFVYVPENLRVLFSNIISVFWNAYLCSKLANWKMPFKITHHCAFGPGWQHKQGYVMTCQILLLPWQMQGYHLPAM